MMKGLFGLFRGRRETTVATVLDEGAAAVIEEALAEAGLAVTVRRVAYNPYRATLSSTTFEVRVPSELAAAAETVLARLRVEAEEEVGPQAAAFTGRPGDDV